MKEQPILSIIIPSHFEGNALREVINSIDNACYKADIPVEFIIMLTAGDIEGEHIVNRLSDELFLMSTVRYCCPIDIANKIRTGMCLCKGKYWTVCMADGSDDPWDVVYMYQYMDKPWDCVFGSRWIKGSQVTRYPLLKRILNRVGNSLVQMMYHVDHNDMTSSLKMYKTEHVETLFPSRAQGFDVFMEIALNAVKHNLRIKQVPVRWKERTSGASKFNLVREPVNYVKTLLSGKEM